MLWHPCVSRVKAHFFNKDISVYEGTMSRCRWAILLYHWHAPLKNSLGCIQAALFPLKLRDACTILRGDPRAWNTDRSYNRRTGGDRCDAQLRWLISPAAVGLCSRHHEWRLSICLQTHKGRGRVPCARERRKGRCGRAVPEENRPLGGKRGWRTESAPSRCGEVYGNAETSLKELETIIF